MYFILNVQECTINSSIDTYIDLYFNISIGRQYYFVNVMSYILHFLTKIWYNIFPICTIICIYKLMNYVQLFYNNIGIQVIELIFFHLCIYILYH